MLYNPFLDASREGTHLAGEWNHLGQPIGFVVPNWSACPKPPRTPMVGKLCHVVPLEVEKHAPDLYRANSEDKEGRMWTYLAYGPFSNFKDYLVEMNRWLNEDWHIHAILDATTGQAQGLASYMRVEPDAGSIEVGAIMYSPRLQRTTAGTEAMYLMMKRVFDELAYRRYEWRCNALNQGSMKAASRLGFQFEGIIRQATVLKGRSRDTAWFSIIDQEWPAIKMALESWLVRENFDSNGRQIKTLEHFMPEKPR
jgi:RimJ/RimL family protein N-acetyltransferase